MCPFFALLTVLFLTPCFAALAQTPPDTLWLTNGEQILVKNVTPNRRTVFYQWATGDSSQREARFTNVLGVRKGDGSCQAFIGRYRAFCGSQAERLSAGKRLVQIHTPGGGSANAQMFLSSFFSGFLLGMLAGGAPIPEALGAKVFFGGLIVLPALPILIHGSKGPLQVTPFELAKYPILHEPSIRAGYESVRRPYQPLLALWGVPYAVYGGVLGYRLARNIQW